MPVQCAGRRLPQHCCLSCHPQVFSFILYGMAGLRADALAVVANCGISSLLYLVGAQVGGCLGACRLQPMMQPPSHA